MRSPAWICPAPERGTTLDTLVPMISRTSITAIRSAGSRSLRPAAGKTVKRYPWWTPFSLPMLMNISSPDTERTSGVAEPIRIPVGRTKGTDCSTRSSMASTVA